jgi:PAS domain S-box-containing protein
VIPATAHVTSSGIFDNPATASPASLAFLAGGGKLGALMRSHDWSSSSLGPPTTWPSSLRTIVSLMLNSRFPMFVAWGEQLAFLYNDAYADILGAKTRDALGRRFQDIWSEIWHDVGPIAARALAGEASYYENLPLLMHRRGFDEQTWFTFSYSPALDDDGKVAGVYCACTETTATVLAERERIGENDRLRAMFEQAPGFMAVLRGPDHVFELTNRAYLQLVGHRDVLDKPLRIAIPEIAAQGFVDILDKVYRSGEPYVGRMQSVMLQHDPGGALQERFLDFVYQPIRNAAGDVVGIFAEGSDVTDRARAIEELRASDRRKDEFLAMLAHELRNPLSPISNAAWLLRDPELPPSKVRSASEVVIRQVDHMTRLVDDLLDVSRVTRGLITLESMPLDMNAVIATAVEQVRAQLDARRHRLSTTTDPSASVLGDYTRMVQVLANLLANAIKFTPDGGNIGIDLATTRDRVRISVTDDGIGIAADVLPRVFDLFTQAERASDRAEGGLGLGLALVRSLVELRGGTVEARSAGAGRGSAFIVDLPRHVAAVPARTHDEAPQRGDADPALHILVVDDNVDAADTLAMLLSAKGHRVSVEHDAERALQRAEREAPAVMLLDIGLPGMDGYELARRLRALAGTAGAVLVALTGYGQKSDRERSAQAGFDHHMVKPANPAQLDAILAAAAAR